MSLDTEIIDKLFLELSQFTNATTAREFELIERIRDLQIRLAILSQPTPGMIPMEYADVDSGARIVSEPSEDRPSTGCWVVRNSHYINPCKEFPTAEAAYHALKQATPSSESV